MATEYAIMIDFGSTYTKLACVNLIEKCTVVTGNFPSTVHEDARIGMHQCFDKAREAIGQKAFAEALKLSSSSAAGGLRMAVTGLTEHLSLVASRNAAFGAGGKIVQTLPGLLQAEDMPALEQSGAEIFLLCGGYERGNRTMVLHNAEVLAASRIQIPVIYAGNSSIATEVRKILLNGNKECFLAANIIPEIGAVNAGPTEDIIRHLFMKRITNMMGMEKVQQEIGEILMPTPAAVLAAGTLLSHGTDQEEGLGELMMVDVGGATTDVYSFSQNKGYENAKLIGAVEPYEKRTVEGDMGMRESSVTIAQEVTEDALAAEADVTLDRLRQGIQRRLDNHSVLPDSEEERKIDQALARSAVRVSVRRHAGKLERVNLSGRANQVGKNLEDIQTIIGIGGVIVNNPNPKDVLLKAQLQQGEPNDVLVPRKLIPQVDQDYVFFAAGLLSQQYPEVGLAIMKASLQHSK